jgi:hypothetical protein
VLLLGSAAETAADPFAVNVIRTEYTAFLHYDYRIYEPVGTTSVFVETVEQSHVQHSDAPISNALLVGNDPWAAADAGLLQLQVSTASGYGPVPEGLQAGNSHSTAFAESVLEFAPVADGVAPR